MKNILKQTPFEELHGRNRFVANYVKSNMELLDKEILNIGCGYGWFENFLLKNNAKKIVGVDYDPILVEELKQHLSDPSLHLAVADALNLPFPDSSFDIVTSFEVIEHVPKGREGKMLSEIYRVLKPGGTAVLSTPYNSILSKVSDPAYWLIGHRHYSKDKLITLSKSVGYVISEVCVVGGPLELFTLSMLYFFKWILRKQFILPSYLVPRLDSEFDRKSGFMNIVLVLKK